VYRDIKGKELAVLRPGEIFGVEGVIHGDAGEGFMSARAPSASHLNPLAEKSSEEDCKRLACQQIPMAPPYSLCVCGPRRRESAFASEDCDLLCLTRDELETMFRRHTALKDRVYRCSWCTTRGTFSSAKAVARQPSIPPVAAEQVG
jgi:CRP-like cAMP-binding protein